MSKILVIGHSHMNAPRAVDGAAHIFDFEPFPESGGAYLRRDPAEFGDQAAAAYASVVFMLGGNTHVTLGMLNPPQEAFDFYLPEQLDLPLNGAARLLPVDLVALLLKRHLKSDLDYLDQLARVFAGKTLYHIESPPPLPTEFILRHPAGFADKLKQQGLAPASFRYKFWRLHSRLMRDHCAALGIDFIAVPPGTQDADGCLAAPYLRNDPTHANTVYGALVLNQLCAAHGLAPIVSI